MIGVFDSGLGGLTALYALRHLLPSADIVYFGDTARVPYGSRSDAVIIRYAAEITEFLQEKGAERILAACGTVSAVALDTLSKSSAVPLTGVLEPACRAAVNSTKNSRIGVIATSASIASGAYDRKLLELMPGCKLTKAAAPLLVPMIENGFVARDCEMTRLAVAHYTECFRKAGIDTLILGCTHYPVIKEIFSDLLPGVTLINSSVVAAEELASVSPDRGNGTTEIYLSDANRDLEEISATLGGKLDLSAVKTHHFE